MPRPISPMERMPIVARGVAMVAIKWLGEPMLGLGAVLWTR